MTVPKVAFWWFVFSLISLASFSQSGNDCSNAITITLDNTGILDCEDGTTDSQASETNTEISGGSFLGGSASTFFTTAAACLTDGASNNGEPGSNYDKWYKFTSVSNTIAVALTGSIDSLAVVLWQSSDGGCDNLVYRYCEKDKLPYTTIDFSDLLEGETYYLQIVAPSGATSGTFSGNISSKQNCQSCRSAPINVEVIGASPASGYNSGVVASGTELTFRVTVSNWREVGNNNLHGIDFGFSDNIDEASFTPTITPVSCSGNIFLGEWGFYSSITHPTNGNFGPGYFYEDNGGGDDENDPTDNYGDEDCETGTNLVFEFKITTKVCEDPSTYDPNLILTAQTYSDKETGSYNTADDCADQAIITYLSGICCPVLGPDVNLDVCSNGDAFDLYDDIPGVVDTSDAGGSWIYNSGSVNATFDPSSSPFGVYTYSIESNSFGVCTDTSQNVVISETEGFLVTLSATETSICPGETVDITMATNSSEFVHLEYILSEIGNPGNNVDDQEDDDNTTFTLSGIEANDYPGGIRLLVDLARYKDVGDNGGCLFDPEVSIEVAVDQGEVPGIDVDICDQSSAPDISDHLASLGYSNFLY
ncbi:MAG: hypothetical protein ACI9YL_001397, partial [Luteibaculaceae bacterium]